MQVLLLEHSGTFAVMSNLAVSGKDFSISRIKYLAPMLYDAERSQSYTLPLLNLQSEYVLNSALLPLCTGPEPS